MGIPPEIEYDDDSPCFLTGMAPHRMYATFADIIKCPGVPGAPGPPNGTFELIQNPAHNSWWDGIDIVWFVRYKQWQPESILTCLNIAGGVMAFNVTNPAPCSMGFASAFVCDPFRPFPIWAGGSGRISYVG